MQGNWGWSFSPEKFGDKLNLFALFVRDSSIRPGTDLIWDHTCTTYEVGNHE
jgi:hypothetical protein